MAADCRLRMDDIGRPRPYIVMGTHLLSPKKGAQPPIFGPCLLWSNGWMDRMSIGTMVGLGPSNIVLDADPAPASTK